MLVMLPRLAVMQLARGQARKKRKHKIINNAHFIGETKQEVICKIISQSNFLHLL